MRPHELACREHQPDIITTFRAECGSDKDWNMEEPQDRPIYHRKRDSIEAHLTIVFAAWVASATAAADQLPDQECHSPRGKVRPRSRAPEQGLPAGRRVARGQGRSVYLRPTVASGASGAFSADSRRPGWSLLTGSSMCGIPGRSYRSVTSDAFLPAVHTRPDYLNVVRSGYQLGWLRLPALDAAAAHLAGDGWPAPGLGRLMSRGIPWPSRS
jgi:hypothetical protein